MRKGCHLRKGIRGCARVWFGKRRVAAIKGTIRFSLFMLEKLETAMKMPQQAMGRITARRSSMAREAG